MKDVFGFFDSFPGRKGFFRSFSIQTKAFGLSGSFESAPGNFAVKGRPRLISEDGKIDCPKGFGTFY
jgi:hypothetical protein